MTSPYSFYQYWLDVEDASVGQLLRVFTDRTADEIEALEQETADRPQARTAQRTLAGDVTTLVHGAAATEAAIAASAALFGRGDLSGVDEPTLRAVLAEAGLHPVSGVLHVNAPVRDGRTGEVAVRGPPGGRRGRGLHQQRTDRRPGSPSGCVGSAARALPGAAPRQARSRRCRADRPRPAQSENPG